MEKTLCVKRHSPIEKKLCNVEKVWKTCGILFLGNCTHPAYCLLGGKFVRVGCWKIPFCEYIMP